MPTTRRSRGYASEYRALWAIVGDPYQLPRWWPKVERVERVSDGRFAEVLRTEHGRPVRAEFRITRMSEFGTIAWAQELAGTSFERVLRAASVTVDLFGESAVIDTTVVTLTLEQRLRGFSRLGALLVRRASRKVLDEALEGLDAALHEDRRAASEAVARRWPRPPEPEPEPGAGPA